MLQEKTGKGYVKSFHVIITTACASAITSKWKATEKNYLWNNPELDPELEINYIIYYMWHNTSVGKGLSVIKLPIAT